ncbi:AraC family transcriptional regulator [Roseibium algae]|uniref:AraC family transcriptional regulator ligand-binding domain-containing protein n=1 Tax=Roseibium algae TaxID=3123038 RepID=A0ABU8TGS0_9HYPH
MVLGELASQHGVNWTELLKSAGMTEDDCSDSEGRVDARSCLEVFELFATAAGNDALTFDVFSQSPVSYGSIFEYLFLCAATLREGMKNWARFHQTRSNCLNFGYRETDQFGMLNFSLPDHLGPQSQFLFASLGFLCSRIERTTGEDPILFQLEIAAKRPKKASKFQARHGNRITFDADESRILVPSRFLDRIPEGADPSLFRIIEIAALQELTQMDQVESQTSIIAAKISQGLRAGDCSMDYVASAMAMSHRSLQRTLESEGTSYRKVLDDVRRSIAHRHLVDTDRPMKEIAFLLGFSEVSAFSRAVRNWFGVAPRALRQRSTKTAAISDRQTS